MVTGFDMYVTVTSKKIINHFGISVKNGNA